MARGPELRVASAARTTNGNSGSIHLGSSATANVDTEGETNVNLLVDATAVSGTGPSLGLTVEWSHDAGTTFASADPADSFTAIAAVGAKVKGFAVKAPHYRVVWAITGTTPSFTFSIREYLF